MMLTILLTAALPAMIVAQDAVRYDRLTLVDGQVITGRVEHEASDHLLIRVTELEGKVDYVMRIDRHRMLKHEKAELPPVNPAPASQPSTQQHASVSPERVDKLVFLQGIFEEWRIRNLGEASRKLLKLISEASAEDLAALDELTRREFSVELAEFAARIHFEYALQGSSKGYFRLYFLNPLTVRPTHKLLSDALREELPYKFTCSGHLNPETTCERTDSIAQWLDQPQAYDADPIHAAQFSRQVSKVLGMNRELIRVCQALHRDPAEIVELNAQREQLRRLLNAINERKSRP